MARKVIKRWVLAFLGVLLVSQVAVAEPSQAAATLPESHAVQQTPSVPVTSTPQAAVAVARELAPRTDTSPKVTEFVDVARLVLEQTRDQTAATAAHIDRAIYLIIAIFALLGGVGGWLGWSKLNTMETKAEGLIQTFNSDLDQLRQSAGQIRDGFTQSLDAAMNELRAEINGRIELLTARAEIAYAENETDPKLKLGGFASAISRIESALLLPDLPSSTKIKGLADLGYAKKRQGDVNGAMVKVMEAAGIAELDVPAMFPLLAYNAACYAVLLGRADARQWLQKAIHANAEYRESACQDADFSAVHQEQWFIELIKK